MSKLLEWLVCFSVFAGVWLSFFLPLDVFKDVAPWTRDAVLWSPLFLIASFGIVSVAIILYRVATFNNCTEAAEELKHQIIEARAELKAKGIRL